MEDVKTCDACLNMNNMVKDFQTHNHTFTCQKKNRVISIRSDEGHGKNDGTHNEKEISNYVHCRFNFPHFPLNKTTFILGIPKDCDEQEVRQRKKDLKKIKKYLIRQTFRENMQEDSSNLIHFENLSFIEFLHEVGMFTDDQPLQKYSVREKNDAYGRYIYALSASIQGTGSVFLKRGTKDVFTNNYNRKLMKIHKANHDIQIVVDQVKL